MNVVQYENYAFIFPDDMDSFRKRYGVDVLWVDIFEGEILGLGPSDTAWRNIPAEDDGTVKVVKFGGKD